MGVGTVGSSAATFDTSGGVTGTGGGMNKSNSFLELFDHSGGGEGLPLSLSSDRLNDLTQAHRSDDMSPGLLGGGGGGGGM